LNSTYFRRRRSLPVEFEERHDLACRRHHQINRPFLVDHQGLQHVDDLLDLNVVVLLMHHMLQILNDDKKNHPCLEVRKDKRPGFAFTEFALGRIHRAKHRHSERPQGQRRRCTDPDQLAPGVLDAVALEGRMVLQKISQTTGFAGAALGDDQEAGPLKAVGGREG